jgi:hypothetical protein
MGGATLKLAAVVVMLVLVLAGCAAREGGTGSGSDAGPTSAEEETTSYKTQEETTSLEEGRIASRPPHTTLSHGGREVRGILGSYCTATACYDVALLPVSPKQKALIVPSGSEMVFRYGGRSSPDTVKADAYTLNKKRYPAWSSRRSLEGHGSGAERTIHVELPPEEYAVEIFVKEQRSDASYSFRVMVK